MEFKAGDRVHVIKLNKSRVDFYATLKGGNDGNPFILSDCSDGRFECSSVFKPNTGEVGLNKWDYYVLVEDEEDIGGNNMPTIKHTRESIAELEQECEQYKRERDSLIKDVEKMREELKDLEDDYGMVNGNCMYWEDKFHWLNEQYDKLLNKYTNLTEHIKNKALHNPSVHRYIDLVHFIDDLERD